MELYLFRYLVLQTTVMWLFFNQTNILLPYTYNNLNNDCRLQEEKINGKTAILYIYNSTGNLLQERHILEGFNVDYEYNKEGFLVQTTDNSPIGFKTNYYYNNGLLIKSIKVIFSESIPLTTEYAYDATGELKQIKETLYSTTTTNFKNNVATEIINDSKKFELSTSGLVLKIESITGNSNNYIYDNNEQLKSIETLGQNKNVDSKKQYIYSNIKKNQKNPNLSKGFPSYKNPYGNQAFMLAKTINLSTDQATKYLVKTLEEDKSFKTDMQGKLISEEITIGNIKNTKEYIYEDCN